MTKRFGFTLAEVLITLGIIGVVAAMTIPTLISNTNGAQFKTAYKKALSTLNQAVIMNIAIDDTDFSTLIAEDADTDGAANTMSALLDARMQSATNISESYFGTDGVTTNLANMEFQGEDLACTSENNENTAENTSPCKGQTAGTTVPTAAKTEATVDATTFKVFSFADGTAFGFAIDNADCTDNTKGTANACVGFIDVNGSTGPNTIIDCAEAESGECESSEITDVYPVYLHGQTVEPASDSARAVLFGK